jgi:hypothetical protein
MDAKARPVDKRRYASPTLQRLGSVADLTKTGMGTGTENAQFTHKKPKTPISGL